MKVICFPTLSQLFDNLTPKLEHQIVAGFEKYFQAPIGSLKLMLLHLKKQELLTDGDIVTMIMISESAADTQNLVAFGQLINIDHGDWTVINLFKDCNSAPKGIGAYLLKCLENFAHKHLRVPMLRLDCDAFKLAQYYQKLGWKLQGNTFLNDGKFHLEKYY